MARTLGAVCLWAGAAYQVLTSKIEMLDVRKAILCDAYHISQVT
jgi:hypothetical protein